MNDREIQQRIDSDAEVIRLRSLIKHQEREKQAAEMGDDWYGTSGRRQQDVNRIIALEDDLKARIDAIRAEAS